jgi:hypothetical protein
MTEIKCDRNEAVFGLECSPVDLRVTPGETPPIDSLVTIVTRHEETDEVTGTVTLRLDDLLELVGTACNHISFVTKLRT